MLYDNPRLSGILITMLVAILLIIARCWLDNEIQLRRYENTFGIPPARRSPFARLLFHLLTPHD